MNTAATATVPNPCAITAERLRLLAPTLLPHVAEMHAIALEHARIAGGLISAGRVRHFMAQAATETNGFKSLVENLNYRDPVRLDRMFSAVRGVDHARQLIAKGPAAIANCAYANRGGNGDEASGDGWRFRGRGYLQVTLRNTYRRVGAAVRLPLEDHPELLEQPVNAALAAARYWQAEGINACADADDIRAVTARINPALAGLDDRTAWLGRARKVWP